MRTNPTGRQLRLGAELRKLREQAGLTSTAAAQLLGMPQAQVSNMETGRLGVSAERVRTLACQYECSDKALVEAIAGMVGGRKRGWWEDVPRDPAQPAARPGRTGAQRPVAPHDTVTARIPGLLQTLDHAREIFRQAVTELSPPEIEHRLSFRIKRQAVLYRDDPTPYEAIIHEAALRMKIGGPSVAHSSSSICSTRASGSTSLCAPSASRSAPTPDRASPSSTRTARYRSSTPCTWTSLTASRSWTPRPNCASTGTSSRSRTASRSHPEKTRDLIHAVIHDL